MADETSPSTAESDAGLAALHERLWRILREHDGHSIWNEGGEYRWACKCGEQLDDYPEAQAEHLARLVVSGLRLGVERRYTNAYDERVDEISWVTPWEPLHGNHAPDPGACEEFLSDPREPWVCACGVHELNHGAST